MHRAFPDRRPATFAAWSLAVVLVATAGCGSSTENPLGPAVDIVAPTVSSTDPLDGALSVSVITASFSEAMNASTITAATFAVSGPDAALVTGTVTYSGSTAMASFTPSSALAPGTVYVATITTGAEDVAGNALAGTHVWSFRTATTTRRGGDRSPGEMP